MLKIIKNCPVTIKGQSYKNFSLNTALGNLFKVQRRTARGFYFLIAAYHYLQLFQVSVIVGKTVFAFFPCLFQISQQPIGCFRIWKPITVPNKALT